MQGFKGHVEQAKNYSGIFGGYGSKRTQKKSQVELIPYDCIRADPAVADMLGDRIQLGMPFAESSSSVTINGVRRNRLELVIPVTGSEGEGRVRLLAEQDGISLLEVNVGGRIIDVRVGKRSIYGSRNDIDDAIIDANVVDKQIY